MLSVHTPSRVLSWNFLADYHDMVYNTSVDDFRDVLRRSEHIVVIAGSGLSAASGTSGPRLEALYYRLVCVR